MPQLRSIRLQIGQKQPALFPRNAGVTLGRPRLPPLPQQVEDLGRKHHITVLAAFRLHDADDHLLSDPMRILGPIALPSPAVVQVVDAQIEGWRSSATRPATGRRQEQ